MSTFGEIQQHQDLNHIDDKLIEVNNRLARIERQNKEIIALLKEMATFKPFVTG